MLAVAPNLLSRAEVKPFKATGVWVRLDRDQTKTKAQAQASEGAYRGQLPSGQSHVQR